MPGREMVTMGAYDYYKLYCVCPGCIKSVPMVTTDLEETTSYPVSVFNVNMEFIGVAADKEEYILIWNNDPTGANQVVGVLSGAGGPFLFTITVLPGQVCPVHVYGNPGEGGWIITEDGLNITQETGENLKVE